MEIINTITNRKRSGARLDGIQLSKIKLIVTVMSPVFSYVINFILKSRSFPYSLKVAKVIPVHKKGNPKGIVNYRPICLLLFFE